MFDDIDVKVAPPVINCLCDISDSLSKHWPWLDA